MSPFDRRTYNRRSVLRAGMGAAAALPFALNGVANAAGATDTPTLRWPDSVPYPSLPLGQKTGAFPFDHIVIAMMENHSFDNYLGMLPLRGQPKADGFTFNKAGEPINWNPLDGERMVAYHQSGAIGA
jgi:phospholipase C